MNLPALLHPPVWVVMALRRLTLAKRGSAFLCCGLMFVFAVFGGLSVLGVRKSAERSTQWTMRAARAAAQRFQDRLEHRRDQIAALARWPGIAESLERLQAGTPGEPPWVTLYYLTADPHDFADCVFVTGRDGTIMWTKPAGLGLLNRNVSGYSEIQEALQRGKTYVSNVIESGIWPEPHVLVTAPIRNRQNEIVGLVGDVITRERLRGGELVAGGIGLVGEAEPGFLSVADARGFIVTSTDPDQVFTQITDDDLLQHVARGEESFSTSDRHGLVRAIYPIPSLGWALVSEYPTEALYREVYQLERNLVAVGLLLTVITLLVCVPFISSFVSPLRNLTAEAERIAAGDLSHAIAAEGDDEVTRLGESLEHMRQQLQSQRRALQDQISELQKMSRLKSEFIANLSHEFRTPVHIMRGYTDLVLQGAFGEVPNTLHEPLTIVSTQYTSLWSLLESCLDVAKLDSGEVYAQVQQFDLCALVREVMEDFAPQLAAKGLRSLVLLPEHCQPGSNGQCTCQILTDRGKLQRILRHLISNAVKFTHKGDVEVRVEQGPSDTFRLCVRDTGIGIRPEDQPIVFERFRQVDGSATRRHGGIGLGLHVANELVRFLGGSMSLSSAPGTGSTFSLILPRTYVGAPAEERKPYRTAAVAQQRLM